MYAQQHSRPPFDGGNGKCFVNEMQVLRDECCFCYGDGNGQPQLGTKAKTYNDPAQTFSDHPN